MPRTGKVVPMLVLDPEGPRPELTQRVWQSQEEAQVAIENHAAAAAAYDAELADPTLIGMDEIVAGTCNHVDLTGNSCLVTTADGDQVIVNCNAEALGTKVAEFNRQDDPFVQSIGKTVRGIFNEIGPVMAEAVRAARDPDSYPFPRAA